MPRARHVSWLVLATALGCAGERDDAALDEGAFSVSDVSSSVLPAIERSDGKPRVCLGLIGYANDDARERAADKLKSLVADAATKWNALLAGNQDWSVHHAIEPDFHVRRSECAPEDGDFNVNLWATVRRFKADYCSRSTTCSSGAVASLRTLFLGPWNRDEEADPFEPFATLHEYGHLLGLGDTYRIPGAHDWRGRAQPDSVMSGGSETLTEDDKLGLWVVVRAVKTGVRSCTGFGANVRMTHNDWDSLMCDPRARSVTNHR